MTDYERQHSITQCRIEARRLLKQLRSGAPDEVASAVARFRKLQSFSSTSLGDISHLLERVRLKHSLAVVAQERGFESWRALKGALEPEPQTGTPGLDFTQRVEFVVLAVRERAARCRVRGAGTIITLRAHRIWHIFPGEIVVVRPHKEWSFAGHSYLSGEIESTTLDAAAIGLQPLQLEELDMWDPHQHYWGEEGERIEQWAEPIIARGPRREFRLQHMLPGEDTQDPFWDPIIEAMELKDSGNSKEACNVLMDLCQADLRCLDAHAHLGYLAFDHTPKEAIRHYAVGLGIGGLSLPNPFDGLLPWGYIDNRPFLRFMHGYGLCLWRLGRFDEAEQVFEKMLWLNPTDNQGARFLVEDIRARVTWADRAPENAATQAATLP